MSFNEKDKEREQKMKDKENIILIVSATRLFAAKEDNKMTAGKHETSNKAFSQ